MKKYQTVGDRARKWADDNPRIALAVANLRGQAGMGEATIYHTLQRELAPGSAPSIRQMRGAYEKYSATIDHGQGRLQGRRNVAWYSREGGQHLPQPVLDKGGSLYRKRLRAQFTAAARERLNRQTVVGYLIRAEVDVLDYRNREAYVEWEESQEYDRTPPF